MACPNCGHQLKRRALFCPNCGHRLEASPAAAPVSQPRASVEPSAPQRQGCGLSLGVIAVALLILAGLVGLGVVAVRYGLNDRAQIEREIAADHYQRGLEQMQRGDLAMAQAEFELTLQLDPENSDAEGMLAEVRQTLEALPTATPALQQETKSAHLSELRAAFDAGDWELVFSTADRLLALDPTYERAAVDRMLFEAFYRAGQRSAEQDRLEEADRFFDRALAMQPEHEQVLLAKQLVTQYAIAQRSWGQDWALTVELFRPLYALDPDYKDVQQRTHLAYTRYGDDLAGRDQWCAAADQYKLALEVHAAAPMVVSKQQDALARCQNGAAETPQSPPGSGPVESVSPDAPVGPSGEFVGQLSERSRIESNRMFIRGKVLDSARRGLASARVQIQAWDWTAIAVTDGEGQYAFDGLSNPVTYTLSLLDLPSQPFDVVGEWGTLAWVDWFEIK